MSRISGYKIFFVLVCLIFVDQLLKYIIRQGGGFYICNPDIAFGIHILPVIFWIFWTIIAAAVGWQLFRSWKNKQTEQFGLILLLAGALANMIDRTVFGCVIDFIDLNIWPLFNLADSFIAIGALVLVVKWLKMW